MNPKKNRLTTSKDKGVNYLIWKDAKWYKKDGFNFAKTLFSVRPWVHTIHHVLNDEIIKTVKREE